MKLFTCHICKALLSFENVQCLGCGHRLGYLPLIGEVAALKDLGKGLWQALLAGHEKLLYRQCLRYQKDGICNWMIAADDSEQLCRSCRMTSIIPDLSIEGNHEAWNLLELAKRRLWYGLHYLGLPIIDRIQDPVNGLTFAFMGDTRELWVPTGHNDGLITINVIEADPVERERARTKLSEPYRTLLGHMRHESGHYYWKQLVEKSAHYEQVRTLFGDERKDYKEAQLAYYNTTAPIDWAGNFVSDYATMHPWEDWAETWAHYLHMVDSVEIAGYLGLSLTVSPSGRSEPIIEVAIKNHPTEDFDTLLKEWFPLSYANNCLNRSIGHNDWYPFTLGVGAIEKLRLVHTIINEARINKPPTQIAQTTK